jgi:hypothetical protein
LHKDFSFKITCLQAGVAQSMEMVHFRKIIMLGHGCLNNSEYNQFCRY